MSKSLEKRGGNWLIGFYFLDLLFLGSIVNCEILKRFSIFLPIFNLKTIPQGKIFNKNFNIKNSGKSISEKINIHSFLGKKFN